MIFDYNNNKKVAVLLGAGNMGTAIVRRVSQGMTILLGDISEKNLEKTANELRTSSYDVQTQVCDASDPASMQRLAEKAASLGEVKFFVDTAGASPSQAPPEHILKLDLIGTAYALDIFGKVMAQGGAGLVVSSMTGYMPCSLTPGEENELRVTPAEQLKDLACLQKDRVTNPGEAYVVSKRANHLRVQSAAAGIWGERGARINSISPGIVLTPLAYDEFNANGEGYQMMIRTSPAQRVGTSDEIASAAAYLLSDGAAFVTGTDLLIDGGMIAAMKSGKFNIDIK